MNLHELALAGDCSAIESLRSTHEVLDTEVVVMPSAVVNILLRYLNSEIESADVQHWADLLVNNETFVCPNWQDDDVADRYEPMWYVLQRLASPAIDGGISVDNVRCYLKDIEALT